MGEVMEGWTTPLGVDMAAHNPRGPCGPECRHPSHDPTFLDALDTVESFCQAIRSALETSPTDGVRYAAVLNYCESIAGRVRGMDRHAAALLALTTAQPTDDGGAG
jgi:hypothetical protein